MEDLILRRGGGRDNLGAVFGTFSSSFPASPEPRMDLLLKVRGQMGFTPGGPHVICHDGDGGDCFFLDIFLQ